GPAEPHYDVGEDAHQCEGAGDRRPQLHAAASRDAQSGPQDAEGLRREGPHRVAVGEDLDAGDPAGDGGGEGVRPGELREARSAHRLDGPPGRVRGGQFGHRGHQSLLVRAVPEPSAQDAGLSSGDQFLRHHRPALGELYLDDDEIPRRESENGRGDPRCHEGGDAWIKSDKKAAAEAYLRVTKDRMPLEEMIAILNDPTMVITIV